MATADPVRIAQHNDAISAALRNVTAAAEQYAAVCTKYAGQTGVAEAGYIASAHSMLMQSAQNLKSAAYGPVNMVMSHFEEFARSGAQRALMSMGVVDALPADGSSMSSTALASKLGVDEDLLVRLMNNVNPLLFAEPKAKEYQYTPNSMVLMHPQLRNAFLMMYDEYGPPTYKLHEWLSGNKFATPDSVTNNPYTYAHDTKGLDMWEYIAKFPERSKRWDSAMQAQSAQTEYSFAFYPFKETFSATKTTESDVLLMDIGGGLGQAVKAIKTICPEETGRWILADRPDVIDDVKDSLPGIETMKYNFFEPNPVKGALIYYIRRCLHDWPDDDCVKILTKIADVMEPGKSRVLVAEIVLQDTSPEAAWMDLTMMTFGGRERSEKQWRDLFDRAGLNLSKIYGAEGTSYSVIEGYLK